jgi:hypothetical protein
VWKSIHISKTKLYTNKHGERADRSAWILLVKCKMNLRWWSSRCHKRWSKKYILTPQKLRCCAVVWWKMSHELFRQTHVSNSRMKNYTYQMVSFHILRRNLNETWNEMLIFLVFYCSPRRRNYREKNIGIYCPAIVQPHTPYQ